LAPKACTPADGTLREQLLAIINFCAGRYNANRHIRPGLAKAFLAMLS
jgi:hypothetical protein